MFKVSSVANFAPCFHYYRTQFGKRDQERGVVTSVVSETTMASTISKKSTSSYAEKVQVFTKEAEFSERDTSPLVSDNILLQLPPFRKKTHTAFYLHLQ
jgi:hypothetical protein